MSILSLRSVASSAAVALISPADLPPRGRDLSWGRAAQAASGAQWAARRRPPPEKATSHLEEIMHGFSHSEWPENQRLPSSIPRRAERCETQLEA